MSEDNGELTFDELAEIMSGIAKYERESSDLEKTESMIDSIRKYGLDMDINSESGGKIDIDIADINIIEVAAIFSEILKYYVEKEPHLRVDARLSLFSPGNLPEIESQEKPQEEPQIFVITKNLWIVHYNWESAINYYFAEIAPKFFNERSKLFQWDSLSGDKYGLDDVVIKGPNDEPLTVSEALNEGFISVPDYIEME